MKVTQAVREAAPPPGTEIARLEGHDDWVWSVAFSPDGTQLATGSEDDTARLWDLATGREIARLDVDWVWSVAFSPDGMRLATGSKDNTARLWDLATGRAIAWLKGHELDVTSVAFSPDGTRLATGSDDATARLWDLATGRQIALLKHLTTRTMDAAGWVPQYIEQEHREDRVRRERLVFSVAFSPDGTRLATGADDGLARIWQV